MMNLKEAFTHQNKIKEFCQSITTFLSRYENFTKTTVDNKISKVDPAQADFSEELPFNFGEGWKDVDKVISAYKALLDEKKKLSLAVKKAKADNPSIDFDSAVEINSMNRDIENRIRSMLNIVKTKPAKETKKNGGRGNKFNVEGNPVSFNYDQEFVYTPRFNKETATVELKRLEDEVTAMSTAIDEYLITTKVDYAPAFKNSASIEDFLSER